MQTKRFYSGLAVIFASSQAFADGSTIGQIYAPYVQPLEQEIEFVSVLDERDDASSIASSQWAKVGYGTSLFDGVYSELAFTATKEQGQHFRTVELENIWQITEQGEYDSDWGVLLELEAELDRDSYEVSAGILNSRDFGRWTLISNALVAIEWGKDTKDEIETALALQARYRLQSAFEPTLELFVAQDTLALGPGVGGVIRLQAPTQLRWNFVVLGGFAAGADYSVKLEMEYEFF